MIQPIQSTLNDDNNSGDLDIRIQLYHENSQRIISTGDIITVAHLDINIMMLKTTQ